MRLTACLCASVIWLSRSASAQEPAAPSPNRATPESAPYAAEQVTVRSPYGHSLGGTLTLPRHAGRPLPVVLLISGTGPQTRDGSARGDTAHQPFRQIADSLSRRGVAVLRVDDRGVAEGQHRLTSALQVAEDVRAALALLRARADIDPARIALIGHSEGGMVALMVASSDPALRAVVLMAAPAERPIDMLREMNARSAARTHSTEAGRDSVLRLMLPALEWQLQTEWARLSGSYDPLIAARAVQVPSVLVMQGETDWQVPPEHAGRLAQAIRSGGVCDVTERTFPGVNHLFVDDPEGVADYESLPSQRLSSAVLGVLADWTVSRLRNERPQNTRGRGCDADVRGRVLGRLLRHHYRIPARPC